MSTPSTPQRTRTVRPCHLASVRSPVPDSAIFDIAPTARPNYTARVGSPAVASTRTRAGTSRRQSTAAEARIRISRTSPKPQGSLSPRLDLTVRSQLATYGAEQPNTHPEEITYDINTHAIPCDPYSRPCLRSIHALGKLNVTTVPPIINPSCSSSSYERFTLYEFDTPMWELGRARIPFEPAASCSKGGLGINMAQILSGDDKCLKNPREYVRDMAGSQFIDVVFHANGYLPQYIRIPLKCHHQSAGGRYFDVAFNVALGYQKILQREAPNITSSRTNTDLPVVTDVEDLHLISLYSADSSGQIWWAEVAFCCCAELFAM
ncbi:hypothetical protein IW261DRAFT_279032 [Armillaria novae-zelandiae]|uniref:Uncharacterized protein n=1 Tax=Armillaria novae-zelandiae TaxID=153914 RepID=A0AA39N827_9AGAR|nr:hypothetical protein IW261DRAFT_279032 [Armillaria novae-zelandiae]